ncbi:hypothetical protein KBTX_01494 [wastewater metagenome]|uniref:Uncharacterized protein n=2 Tax=unclassified sequences TaxID=12908 RepID=A0A5B8REC8_9ZZZZ|nr:hypothetical protein [Arhodomonas sp. KWT]QEA05175.1 hypothetical protein KBTEX_01494 [uncultured organism]
MESRSITLRHSLYGALAFTLLAGSWLWIFDYLVTDRLDLDRDALIVVLRVKSITTIVFQTLLVGALISVFARRADTAAGGVCHAGTAAAGATSAPVAHRPFHPTEIDNGAHWRYSLDPPYGPDSNDDSAGQGVETDRGPGLKAIGWR